MQPTKEWLEKWEKVKDKLQPSSNLEDYFTLKEIPCPPLATLFLTLSFAISGLSIPI